MRRSLLALALCLPMLLGCPATTATPAATLAPGYSSMADQQMGEVLAGARTFYSTIQCETKGLNWSQLTSQCVSDPNITSPMVLSDTEKKNFNDFGKSLNLAETVYISFHNGTATQQAAQDQVNIVQSKQNDLPALAVTH